MTQPNRQRAIAIAAVLLCGLPLASCGGAPDRPPNLLLITIDTLRMDHTTLGGYERDTTPALAEWARGGVVFDRAYSASSWTLPAMSMLLTGQAQVKNKGRIFPNQSPLAEALRERGYRTGAVMSNPLLTSERGFDRGFDQYEIKAEHQPGALGWLAPGVTERGIRFMSRGRKPFFLLLHYFDPHDPYRPIGGLAFSPFNREQRKRAFAEALPAQAQARLTPGVYAGIEERIAQYDSEVLQTDRSLQQLFEWMDSAGLTENTIVVVTADHGEGLWQRAATLGETPKEVFFPALYFEHGVQLYAEQVHVPLVFRGPGIPAGLRSDTPVSLIDVVPSLLSLLNLPQPALSAGVALLPEIPGSRELPIFAICSRGITVTVDGRYRLHQPRDYKLKQGVRPELFDLIDDPLELTPLDDPQREAQLRGLIDAWMASNEAIEWGAVGPLDRQRVRAELNALGYAAEEMFGEDFAEQSAPGGNGPDVKDTNGKHTNGKGAEVGEPHD